MKTKEFDLLDGVNLSEEDKKYYMDKRQVSDIIIQMIKRRFELNMTQRELAEKSGIKQPMIARIEQFDSVPRIDTFLKLLNALKLHINLEESYEPVIEFKIEYKSTRPSYRINMNASDNQEICNISINLGFAI